MKFTSALILTLATIVAAAAPAFADRKVGQGRQSTQASHASRAGLSSGAVQATQRPVSTQQQRIRLLCATGELSGIACTAKPIKKG